MNKHLEQRVMALLNQYDSATLATCGAVGPQMSVVAYRVQQLSLYLFIPHMSDHLFNLESRPTLVLLAPRWKLHGHGQVLNEAMITPPQHWQMVVQVQPVCLHVLSEDSQHAVETIDFS